VSLCETVSHPSRCDLTMVRIDVVVMLKSAKDSILGVDIPGQQVSPRVWYGTTYLLIRYVVGCVSCSVEWG
jgi:hypothetical protein